MAPLVFHYVAEQKPPPADYPSEQLETLTTSMWIRTCRYRRRHTALLTQPRYRPLSFHNPFAYLGQCKYRTYYDNPRPQSGGLFILIVSRDFIYQTEHVFEDGASGSMMLDFSRLFEALFDARHYQICTFVFMSPDYPVPGSVKLKLLESVNDHVFFLGQTYHFPSRFSMANIQLNPSKPYAPWLLVERDERWISIYVNGQLRAYADLEAKENSLEMPRPPVKIIVRIST
jgi:hypothetical protein